EALAAGGDDVFGDLVDQGDIGGQPAPDQVVDRGHVGGGEGLDLGKTGGGTVLGVGHGADYRLPAHRPAFARIRVGGPRDRPAWPGPPFPWGGAAATLGVRRKPISSRTRKQWPEA